MLLDDVHITIAEIQRLQEKGRTMTLAEKDQLDNYYLCLSDACGTYDIQTKTTKPFTLEQYQFVKHVFLIYVRKNIPKLKEVMALYDLSFDTIFVWEDTSGPYNPLFF